MFHVGSRLVIVASPGSVSRTSCLAIGSSLGGGHRVDDQTITTTMNGDENRRFVFGIVEFISEPGDMHIDGASRYPFWF